MSERPNVAGAKRDTRVNERILEQSAHTNLRIASRLTIDAERLACGVDQLDVAADNRKAVVAREGIDLSCDPAGTR